MLSADHNAVQSGHMVYLCTCEQMQSTVQEIVGLGAEARGAFEGAQCPLARTSCWPCPHLPCSCHFLICVADFQQHIKPCIHAQAVGYLTAQEEWLDHQHCYDHASDVLLDVGPVVICNGSMKAEDVLLSVSTNTAGLASCVGWLN